MSIKAIKLALEALENASPAAWASRVDSDTMKSIWRKHAEALEGLQVLLAELDNASCKSVQKRLEAQQPATGKPVAWLDEMLADTREVFDAGGSETPQVVRDVIEYVASWVTVYSEKNRPAPSVPADVVLDRYDAGLLNDFGGGNVEWWQDYIRAELGNAHDFYQSQITTPQPAQATQAEVTDSMIREAFIANGFTIKDGHSDLKPYVYAAARAILAMRPERVPMTEDQVWHNDALMSANGTAGFKMDALMRIVRATEAHHFGITTQPKGGE